MGDLDGLFASLSASFDAQVRRDEDEAASDLAFTLFQDQELPVALSTGSWRVRLPDSSTAPVTAAGDGYVVARTSNHEIVVPASAAVVEGVPSAGGVRPEECDLIARLRRWARRAPDVEIDTLVGTVRGRLVAARDDHVYLDAPSRRFAVGIGAITAIRRALTPTRRGGSRDAS